MNDNTIKLDSAELKLDNINEDTNEKEMQLEKLDTSNVVE